MLSIYIIIGFLSILIFRKTIILFITLFLNLEYIWQIFNYKYQTEMYKYILAILAFIIIVFKKDSIMPLLLIYIYIFLIYEMITILKLLDTIHLHN